MPTPEQITKTSAAIAAIRQAQDLLSRQMQITADAEAAAGLTDEYMKLDALLSQLLQAQNAADDADFNTAAGDLKTQAGNLSGDENKIKAVVSDINTAATIIGILGQIAVFISTL